MCKNWIETGFCRYHAKCQFAHGDHELVQKDPRNEKYKSKECASFNNRLHCPYGKRCLFRHDDRTSQDVQLCHYQMQLDLFAKQYENENSNGLR